MSEKTEHILDLARERGIIRPKELDAYGIPKRYLYRLEQQGSLQRVGRGLYALPDAEPGEHWSLAEAAKRVPSGVICLLSALRFHDLTTQAPFEVWMAIGQKAWRPRVAYPPLRVVRFSGNALREGIEDHVLEGVHVRVFSPAKTVADCFKYRNKIGLDVAIEALRESLRARRCSRDDLWGYARVCRVHNVMRPYLEAFTA